MTCDDKGKGKITIGFKDDDEMMKIFTLLDSIKKS